MMSSPTLHDVVQRIYDLAQPMQPTGIRYRSDLRRAMDSLTAEGGLTIIARTLQDMAEKDLSVEYARILQDALGHVNRARVRRMVRPSKYPAGATSRESDFKTIGAACDAMEFSARAGLIRGAINRIRANDEDRINELRAGLIGFEKMATEMRDFGAVSHACVLDTFVKSLRDTFGIKQEEER